MRCTALNMNMSINMLNKNQPKIILLSSSGIMLEFYNFIIYVLLASYISVLLFLRHPVSNSLLIAFSAYAVGYFAHPFCVVFFDFIAYYFRKQLMNINNFQEFIQKWYILPLTKVLHTHSWNLIHTSTILSFSALCFVTLFLLTPDYFSATLNLHLKNFVWINILGVIILSILCIVVSFFGDKINQQLILLLTAVITIAGSFFIYHIYTKNQDIYFIAILISAIVYSICWDNIPVMLINHIMKK